MHTHPTAHASLLVLIPLLTACMEPSVYEGKGPVRRPSPAPRVREAADKQAAPTPSPAPGAPGRIADNVGIVVEKYDTNTVNAAGMSLGVAGRRGRAGLRAAGGPLLARNGLRVGVATGSFVAQLRASARRGRSSSRQQMFITVLSGHEGSILAGSDVFVQRLGFWTPRGYRVLLERSFVGRALAVRPRILGGGRIEVELWPRFTTRRGRVIDVTELATKVVVRDREPLVIGGMNTGHSDVGSVLFGIGGTTRGSTMTMLLTAQIGGLSMDWPKGTW